MSDRPNFPQLEEELLKNWEAEKIFEQTLAKDAPKGRFVFFEGPPTANGKPGIHHVESRAFKDCLLRFRTMQGYLVDRKAGWDTHGLPVEIEVEKQLGFSGKKDIENFGIEPFNKKCRESVWKYLEDWRAITRRIAFWLDMEKPYVTYHSEYIESLWWIIKQIWNKGLLYQDYKVVPHCPRCETSLSSHELAQGYKEVEDPAIYIKFKVTKLVDGSVPVEPEYLVAWTTTPWTLPANVALAVGADIPYVKVKNNGVYLWVAKSRVEEATKGDYEIIEEKEGAHLVGMEYEPLFDFAQKKMEKGEPAFAGGELRRGEEGKKRAWYVVPADFVSLKDGSGIVHTAVMYGVEDFELGQKLSLPKNHLVDMAGRMTEDCGAFAGLFVKDADPKIIEDLESRGLVLAREKVKHTYPFCWRCKAPLIYYAKDSWYIRMSAMREKLIEGNDNINWEPDYIKDGRFGEWLREVKDWAFSRERYWGTPLPIWVCDCGEKTCVGSFNDLRARTTNPLPFGEGQGGVLNSVEGQGGVFDPHRPFIDDILIKCDKCGGQMKRIPEVCDVWFDSGCMPFAQWHYPFENKEKIDPPSLVSGGQATAYPADYISEAIDQTRGWFYTLLAVATLLGKERPYKNVICLGHVLDAQGKKMSKSIGNVVDPVETINKYGADAVRWYMYSINQPGDSKRFDLKALDEMVKKVFMILWNVMTFYELYTDENLKIGKFKNSKNVLDRWVLARLNQLIKESTEQLENYKVTEPVRAIAEFINDLSTWFVRRSRDRFKGADEADKAAAVATLRECLLGITKLMAPFAPFLSDIIYLRLLGGQASVHLEDWPVADANLIDEKLLERMARARSIVSKILEKRAEAGRAVRQPLASASVSLPEGELDAELVKIVKDEVNVKAIVIEKGEYNVELDVNLTPELLREGMSRDIIRRVNEMRKNNKLTIEDRIEIYFESADVEAKKMIEEHGEAIRVGTLSNGVRTTGDRPEICESFRLNECDVVVGFCVIL